MVTLFNYMFGWLPPRVEAMFAGLVAILIVFMVFKLVKIILDSLPFL